MSLIPKITLHADQWQPLDQTHFRLATDGSEIAQPTLISLKYDERFLYVSFECLQNPFWKENTYTAHNTDMWNQEVFEVFIAAGTATPTRYLELEINPNNAVFVGWIENPTKETPAHLTLVPYEKAEIKHEISTEGDTWSGKMQIPWTLIGERSAAYRINFYRIISLVSHPDPHWKCSPSDCVFGCWSPTMSGASPRFHRPDAFGILELK